MTYDPRLLLETLDANVLGFLLLGSITMTFNYIYFGAAIVNARRDRAFAFPLAASTLWFAHDLSFVLLYPEWFGVYDHWYLKLFWVALIPTTLLEVAFIHQVWKYGKDEILPHASREAFLGYIAASVAAGCIAWWSIKYFLDDPIYAYTFGSTGFLAVAFGIPRLIRRGDAAGQSALMWTAYCCMTACWFLTTILYFGPAFRSAPYLLMGAASIAGGAFLAGAARRRPAAAEVKAQVVAAE